MEKILSRRGPLMVLAGAICFSTSGFSQAIAPEGASSYTLSALRMFGGGCILMVWCAWRGLPLRLNRPRAAALPAALGLLFCNVFFFKGLTQAGVVVGTVVTIGSIPIFSALMGLVVLREKPIWAWYPATAIAGLGLVLLHWGGAETVNPFFLVLPLAAGLFYSVFMVFGKSLVRDSPPETVQMLLCLFSGICLLPSFLFSPGAWVFTADGLLVALNLGVTTSALAFTLVLSGLRTTPTATASTLGLAEPLCAALLGIFCLGERLTVFSSAGLLCIFIGMITLIALPPRTS